ncbi:MAG: precorrin-4 C(11)-methyltransferase [Thermodesulfobacteriota bacterium]
MQTHPIQFVGAGPGDPELITVKGRNALEAADLVIYAGSLVPLAALRWAGGARKENSAGMDLETITRRMIDAHDRGEKVVRLHSGDPSLYGAIAEQMKALDREAIAYEVIPGVTAAFAAAAALKIEYTLPETCQTLILTRMEGRTPMPEREQLEALAAHQASLAIYLSTGLADKVEPVLVANYGADAPVAIVCQASQPGERIVRTTMQHLARAIRAENIDRQALILAGKAVAWRSCQFPVSRLYDAHFTHGYRQAGKAEEKE